ncbi:hypothetical protein CPB84DRAFT_1766689 [Gymnopilus junonius]|uniref:Uncharacterized protein n=1 Tax=Gymnopilus junonius TaxID=109634 RepID=A0A9P5TSK8_GYMJU|nr:hypothetical protein CPB84DRAFT_1766689 [Gymnopilus junonius]
MPRLIFEKPQAESPERISRHLRSTPIEIPKRRRPVSPKHNSCGQNESPDMVFEMSPISPDFPASARGHSVSPNSDKDDEPFMYNAPSFRPYASQAQAQSQSKKCSQPLMHSSTTKVAAHLHTHHHTKTSPFCLRDDPITFNSSSNSLSSTLTPSTRKITGFVPLIEHQHLISDEPSKPIQTLPPPPRRPSFSSSPWILPGRGGSHEMDICYSQADPSAFEFRDHLLRRMESRESSRLKSLRSCV